MQDIFEKKLSEQSKNINGLRKKRRNSFVGCITYKVRDYSKQFLQKHKFHYNSYLSDYNDEVYTYKFPLISYNKTTTIECEISVSTMTGVVNVNVYNTGTSELYASYYDRNFGKCEIIKSIDIKIENKLKELGIEKV